ncbi:MAG: bifunctional phosphoglucose/phosphomannose isomerase [Candidatus Thermoplasmatota archaeon]|jgi:glucose/mannose-6-phosphate isomerase|nr:bifunctional phosphoglucose/phosphomannose isomerase [Candidatus Thermoplasmatota archaeon]MCL5989363.1 bifunctional phosphoglucose/phosphomannose isomerase [Candidatus Thermoplasmatota archaeon]
MLDDKLLRELGTLKDQVRFSKKFTIDKDFDNVVVAGMGGSGIVGRIFSELYSEKPVEVVSDYQLPKYANDRTLVIGVSYSGNTEETISVLNQAQKNNCITVAITSGGKISGMGFQTVLIPGGLQPRSSLGYMLMPILSTFLDITNNVRDATFERLKNMDEDHSKEEMLALEIFKGQRIPVIMGFFPFSWVAYRWKTQFNENSKIMAFSNYFPELNHNETMAIGDTFRRDMFEYIAFRGSSNNRIEKRIEETSKITGVDFYQVTAEGNSIIEKLFFLVHYGDYVSYHLAKLRNVDPQDVSKIELLKKRLA